MIDATPMTASGRALLAWSKSDAEPIDDFGLFSVERAILAIEAEARTEGHKEGYLSRTEDERFRAEAFVEALRMMESDLTKAINYPQEQADHILFQARAKVTALLATLEATEP